MMQGAAAPDAGEGQGGIAFVTVTFRDELELLRLQARSMAAFLPDALVAEILVIVNDRDEAAKPKLAQLFSVRDSEAAA